MSDTFYMHRKYRFDGPIIQIHEEVPYVFDANKRNFSMRIEDTDVGYQISNLEKTTVELLLKLVPEAWYKDQFRIYLKDNFYKDLLKE